MLFLDPHSRLLNQAALGVFISAVIFTLGLFTGTHRARMAARLAAAVAFTYGAFFVPPLFQCALVVCSSVLTITTLRNLAWYTVDAQPTPGPTLKGIPPILITLVPIAGLLLYRLGSFSPTPLTWEGTTIDGLLDDVRRDQPWWQILKERLLWNDGILSAGGTSLLFGMPSLIVFREFGPSLAALRGVSVFWILGAILMFALLFRRGFGRLAPCVAALVFGLNEVILIYGRYGSSIAGTMFALVVAVLLWIRLTQRGEPLFAFLFSLALYVATLGYGAARISALVLLLLFFVLSPCISCTRRQRWSLVLIVTATMTSVYAFEQLHNRAPFLLRARTEQLFYMNSQQGLLFTSQVLASRGESKIPLSWKERVLLANELVQKATGPQLSKIMNPFAPEQRSRFPFRDDPPFLKVFAPALFPWMLLGFWAVWRPGRRYLAITCVSLVTLGTMALLLTNRVDSYRAIFLTIPLSIWITVGVSDFIRIIAELRLSKVLIFGGIATGMMWGILPRIYDLYAPPSSLSLQEQNLYYAVSRIPGPLTAVLNLDHKIESAVRMELFKRSTSREGSRGLLDEHVSENLTNERVDSNPAAFEQAVKLLHTGEVLMLAPAHHYRITSGKLRNRGFVVRVSGDSVASVFVISKPKVEVGLDFAPEALLPPPSALEPLYPLQSFNNHIAVDLTSLVPLDTEYDFAPPQKDKTFSGSPAGWRNLRFAHFMGTHATTTLEYAVPEGAEGFQSWIGISPGVGACTKSSAQVLVCDQNDTLLYRSPLLESNHDPVFLSIPLHSVARLRIQITDAGDSRDCDHVDLGDPAFMLPKADAPRQ